MEETNFDTYIKELAFDLIKANLSIKIVKDWPSIKVQLLYNGEVISEDKEEILPTRNDE